MFPWRLVFHKHEMPYLTGDELAKAVAFCGLWRFHAAKTTTHSRTVPAMFSAPWGLAPRGYQPTGAVAPIRVS